MLQLTEQPGHLKALFTRAACFMKKRMYAKAIEDYSVLLTNFSFASHGPTVGPLHQMARGQAGEQEEICGKNRTGNRFGLISIFT